MHVVVQGHRLFVDDGFEGCVIIRQGRKFVSHEFSSRVLIVLMMG